MCPRLKKALWYNPGFKTYMSLFLSQHPEGCNFPETVLTLNLSFFFVYPRTRGRQNKDLLGLVAFLQAMARMFVAGVVVGSVLWFVGLNFFFVFFLSGSLGIFL